MVDCRACPRLVAWREQVAAEKRAAFRDEDYWGRPVPGLRRPGRSRGDRRAGARPPTAPTARAACSPATAPATSSTPSLHRTGFANQPTSTHRDDGLRLTGAWITAPVRCAPPANKPTPAERDTCRPYLERELALLDARVFVPLGAFAYEGLCRILGVRPARGSPTASRCRVDDGRWIVGSFHVSQQNTFTGKLTEPMLDAVFHRARALAWP